MIGPLVFLGLGFFIALAFLRRRRRRRRIVWIDWARRFGRFVSHALLHKGGIAPPIYNTLQRAVKCNAGGVEVGLQYAGNLAFDLELDFLPRADADFDWHRKHLQFRVGDRGLEGAE